MKKPNDISEKQPPKWALRILPFLFKERYLEQIEGDLYELFTRDKSQTKLAWNTVRFMRFRYLKGLDDYQKLTSIAMLKNYLKVTLRTLLRQKSYTLINITGLAVAITCTLLISMYIFYEKSYDDFYPDTDRIYRVANGKSGSWTPTMLSYTIETTFPQVEAVTKVNGLEELFLVTQEKELLQEGALFADEDFFRVFHTEFLEGNVEYALSEPDHIVLTKRVAEKLFPSGSSMGKIVSILEESYIVAGVVANISKKTHLPYQFVIANPIDPNATYHWSGNNTYTYMKLKPDASLRETSKMLEDLYAEKVGPDYIEFTGHESFEALVREYPNHLFAFTMVPISGIHLEKPNLSLGAKGTKQNIILYSLIATFILIIASINYVNLSTARASVRAKEVGIRKSLGSHKWSIILQFLTESLMITFLSTLLAIGLAVLFLDFFNHLTDRSFTVSDLFSPLNILAFFILILTIGPLAGLYPAYFMSGFSPVLALKGGIRRAGSNYLRNGLVAFQFATSVFLIASTIVVYRQVEHLRSKDLGLDISQTLVVENGPALGEKYSVFKSELEKNPRILSVSKTSNVPFHFFPNYQYLNPEQASSDFSPDNVFMAPGTEKVFDFQLLAGRFFKQDFLADTSAILINESLAEKMGWNDPINKELERDGKLYKVVGLIKDFNYLDLKQNINPLVIRYGANTHEIGIMHQNYLLVKYQKEDPLALYELVESKWNKLLSSTPMQARFLDDAFDAQFDSDRRFGLVFGSFSTIAIIIACLGLFALTTFVLQKRSKEIAVRKVLGASTPSLLQMMLLDFSKRVSLGGIIGIVVAFYWLEDWLNDFPVRIELSWYLLVVPILLILVITWVIVSTKSYKAARSNPAVALKEE